jgi:tight adherence protein B
MTLLALALLLAAPVLLWPGAGGRSGGDRRLAALQHVSVRRRRWAAGRGDRVGSRTLAGSLGSAGSLGPAGIGLRLGQRLGQRAATLTRRLPFGAAARAEPRLSRDDVADLTGRLAALARAGVPALQAWRLLASGTGPVAALAATVSGMVSSGGSVGDGLRLAAGGRPDAPGVADAVRWLAVASDVMDRSGAPSALVHDGLAAGVLAELSRADEQEVALAGPRLTAAMLSALPLAGAGLGLLMGANVPAALLTTPAGRLCLVGGSVVWFAGRWWSRRLVASAARAG